MVLSTELSHCHNTSTLKDAWAYCHSACKWYWPDIRLAIPTLAPTIDLCILWCFYFLLHYTLTASHPTSSKNKVRVYWLNVRGVKITEHGLKAGTVDWVCRGGSIQLSPTHWDFEASSIFPPSLGWAPACLSTVTCQDQHSSSRRTEERIGWIFWHTAPTICFRELNRDWTKTIPVAHWQTDATHRKAEQEMNTELVKWCAGTTTYEKADIF